MFYSAVVVRGCSRAELDWLLGAWLSVRARVLATANVELVRPATFVDVTGTVTSTVGANPRDVRSNKRVSSLSSTASSARLMAGRVR